MVCQRILELRQRISIKRPEVIYIFLWLLLIKELLGRKSSSCGLENRECGLRDPSRWPCDTLYPQKMALTSPTSGGRSVDIVRSLRPRNYYYSGCYLREDSGVREKARCLLRSLDLIELRLST
jgi:hypothetical protein